MTQQCSCIHLKEKGPASSRVMQNSKDKTCKMLCRRQGTHGYTSGWKIQIQTKKKDG
jgi:hypothetical protein